MLAPSTYRAFGGPAYLNTAEGVVRGYVFIWGDPEHRDSYDTYFDPSRPPELGVDPGPVSRPMSYEHTFDGVLRKELIGFIDRVWYDDKGLAYEGHLDRSSSFFDRIVSELRAGKLKTSSATMDHTADFYEDGAFKVWWLGELALTQEPAESRMPASVLVRSRREGKRAASRQNDEVPNQSTDTRQEDATMEEKTLEELISELLARYSLDEIMAALQQMQEPAPAALDGTLSAGQPTAPEAPRSFTAADLIAKIEATRAAQKPTPQQTELESLRKRVDDMEKQRSQQQMQPPAPSTEPRRAPVVTPNVRGGEDLKYAHLSAAQMAFGMKLLAASVPPMLRSRLTIREMIDSGYVSEGYVRSMTHKISLAVDAMKPRADDLAQVDYAALRSAMPFRTNEIASTDVTGFGAEWVGEYFDTNLWEQARSDAMLFNEMVSRGMEVVTVPQGAGSMKVLLDVDNDEVYTLNQAHDVDVTGRPETTVLVQPTLTDEIEEPLAVHAIAKAVSYELQEDSVIAVASYMPDRMRLRLTEALESAMINGDKTMTANANINRIDGTVPSGLQKPHYVAFDGIRHQFLIDNPTYKRDAAGALELADFLLTLGLLPEAIRTRKDNILFILSGGIEDAARLLPELLTAGVGGQRATIYSGEMPPLFGVDPMTSGFMPKTNASGYVSVTAGNNTKDTLAAVYAPYWKYGRKRAITIETDRIPLSQSMVFVATIRHAFKARGAGAAAGSYNIG